MLPGVDHRVTVNSFRADGGDNCSVLVDDTHRLGGEVDLDASVTYSGVRSRVPPDRRTGSLCAPGSRTSCGGGSTNSKPTSLAATPCAYTPKVAGRGAHVEKGPSGDIDRRFRECQPHTHMGSIVPPDLLLACHGRPFASDRSTPFRACRTAISESNRSPPNWRLDHETSPIDTAAVDAPDSRLTEA